MKNKRLVKHSLGFSVTRVKLKFHMVNSREKARESVVGEESDLE